MAGFGDTKVRLVDNLHSTQKIWNILCVVHNVNGEDVQKEDSRGYLQLAGLKITEKVGAFYLVDADTSWNVSTCGGRVTYISPNRLFTLIQHDGLLCVVISTPMA